MQSTQAPAVFTFRSINVRAITISGEPWFVASDVAKALCYRDAEKLTRMLDDDEKGTHVTGTRLVGTPLNDGITEGASIINESGISHAMVKSRRPEAIPFRKWVTSEVLPAIRKTGRYQVQTALPLELPTANALRTRLAERFETPVSRATAEARVLEHFGAASLSSIPESSMPRVLADIDYLADKAKARAESSRANGRKGGRPRLNPQPAATPRTTAAQPNKKNTLKHLSFIGINTKDETEPWVVNNMRTNTLIEDWPKGDALFAEVAKLAEENEHEAYRAIWGAIGAGSTWSPDGFLELGFSRALACAAIAGLRALRHGMKAYEPINP